MANGCDSYSNPDAPSGTQAIINGTGSISQTVTFADSGEYQLSFKAADCYYNEINGGGTNPIMVQVDGVTVGTITPNSQDYQTYQTNLFPVSAGTHQITLQGSIYGEGNRATFVDDLAITKTDPIVQVTLGVDHGVLCLNNTNGLSFSDGDGQGDAQMTFSGNLLDINTALNGMKYLPAAGFTGTDDLQITTNYIESDLPGDSFIINDHVGINVLALSIAAETLVNTTTDNVQQTAANAHSVAADANGNYVVVWSSWSQDGGWDVFGQRYNSDGIAQGDQFQVNTHATLDQQDAKVAMCDDGTFAVTWTESNGGAAGTSDVYLRTYGSDGTALQQTEVLVNDTTAGDQLDPSVTINNNGVFVAWTTQNQDGKWDVYGKWFDDAGNANYSEFQINTTSSEAPTQTQVGMDPWGYVMVVWQSETGGQQDILGRYGSFCNDNNDFDTGEYRLNSTTAGNQYDPSLGFKSSDGCFCGELDQRRPGRQREWNLAQQFDYCGNPIGSEFQVNSIAAGDQVHSSATMDNRHRRLPHHMVER